jgi:hypothetical protein
MSVEIDQSGKIEQLDKNTIVALANDSSSAIFISASSKRKLFFKLRKSKTPRNILYPQIFTILIYLAIHQMNECPNVLLIDEEYTGKNKLIKDMLLTLIKKSKPKWNGDIRFKLVGKLSPSHRLAWGIHTKTLKVSCLKTNEIEILKYLK